MSTVRSEDLQATKIVRTWAFPPWAMIAFLLVAVFNAGISYKGLTDVVTAVDKLTLKVGSTDLVVNNLQNQVLYLNRDMQELRGKVDALHR